MSRVDDLPAIVREISFDGLTRIDVALEGNWSPTVVTVWTRETRFVGFSEVARSHPTFQPALELYFKNAWLGIHCYRHTEGQNVFDEELARRVIDYVESRVTWK